jgi:hypothetical protein
MRITVKFIGISTLNPSLERCKEMHVDLPGHTLGELSHYLMSELDSEAQGAYLTELGEIKFDLLVIVNGIGIWDAQRINLRLKEGYQIELVLP